MSCQKCFPARIQIGLFFLFFCLRPAQGQGPGDAVRIVQRNHAPVFEICNGLMGLVLPLQISYRPGHADSTLAPIQSVIYRDGTYSDGSPNYLHAPTPPLAMQVQVLINTPARCMVQISYRFHKPKFLDGSGDYPGGGEGEGFYRSTITLDRGSRSAVIEEEADFEIYYEFRIHNGLNPDRARYRGWNAQAPEYGYEPGGGVYRPEDRRKPLDATIDLHYEKQLVYPWLNLWAPLGGEINTGRYWQLFNQSAPASANLLGFYQGRASRLLGAHDVGPRLVLRPAQPAGAKNDGAGDGAGASIQVFITRRTPDNQWYPKKRYQWCLFVSTKADLADPDKYQPIGHEMNMVSGMGAKVDSFARTPARLIPAFYQGALYMPAEKVQALIAQVKSDPAFCNLVNGVDSYFKTITDAWRYPDSARSAVRSILNYGEQLKEIYKNGDGIHEYNTSYWKGGFRYKDKVLEISCLFADKSIPLSPGARDSLEQMVRMMARIEWDNDNVPFFDSAGINFGPANMSFQYQSNGRNFFALLFAQDPAFRDRAAAVTGITRANLIGAFYDNGASFGTPHYTQATIDPILFVMLQLKQAGVVNLFAEQKQRLEKFIDFYTTLLTPPSVRFSGYRKLISFGDGSEESAVTFGLLGSGFAQSDPALSHQLYSILQHGAPRLSLFGHVVMAIDLAGNFPPPLQGGSANFPGYLSCLRSGENTAHETAVWVLNGDKFFDHRNDDAGEAAIYALGAPLSVSRSSFYYPAVTDARMRSGVVPEALFGEWNRNSQAITPRSLTSRTWTGSDQLDFAKLAYSDLSVSQMKTTDRTWVRHLMMIHLREEQPVIVFYDSVQGTGANIWSLPNMSQGAVATPAGPLTPRDTAYKNVNGPIQGLPPVTPEKPLAAGLNLFTFTGQSWSAKLHPAGGIDWDLYTISGGPSSFNLSQWTNSWQNSQEASEFYRTNARPYSETQQILRIRSDRPFFHLLLPYNKGTAPYRGQVRLAAADRVSLPYGSGQLLIGAGFYRYTAGDTLVVTTFTGGLYRDKGIEISGGVTELEIAGEAVTVRIHGLSGTRSLQVPFRLSAPGNQDGASLQVNPQGTRIRIDYTSGGADLLSTAQGYKVWHFQKKK